MIVATPTLAATEGAAVGGVTLRKNVSVFSTVVSPSTGTSTKAVVCPAAKLSVPLVAV